MLFIPIGHEESTVQRLPWVTFTIIGICFLVYAGTSSAPVEDPDLKMLPALRFYMERMYLEADPELEAHLKQTKSYGQNYDELFDPMQSPESIPDEELLQAEQDELDELTEAWKASLAKLKEHPLMRYGLVPAQFSFGAVITSMFLHGGFLHLFGNMLILFMTGPFLENKWGRTAFAVHYLTSGLVAGVFFASTYPNSTVPLIGASGAIAGAMGAFLVRFWSTKIKFFYTIGFRAGIFDAPAWFMLPLWLFDQMLSTYQTDYLDPEGKHGGVAYLAHVVGFLWGAGGALLIRFTRFEERFILPALEAEAREGTDPLQDQAAEAMDIGQPLEALRLLRQAVQENPNSTSAILALWDVSVATGTTLEAAPLLLRWLRQQPLKGPEAESTLAYWVALQQHVPEIQPDFAFGMKLLDAMMQQGLQSDAAALLPLVLAKVEPSLPLAPQIKLAKLAHALGNPQSDAWIQRALAAPNLPDSTSRELKKLLETPLPAPPTPKPIVEAVAPPPQEEAEPEPEVAVPKPPPFQPKWASNNSSMDMLASGMHMLELPEPAAPARPAPPPRVPDAFGGPDNGLVLDPGLSVEPRRPAQQPAAADHWAGSSSRVPQTRDPFADQKQAPVHSQPAPVHSQPALASPPPAAFNDPFAAAAKQPMKLDLGLGDPGVAAPPPPGPHTQRSVPLPPSYEPAGTLMLDLPDTVPPPTALPTRAVLQVTQARPLGLQGNRLGLQTEDKRTVTLGLERVRGIAVASIQKPGAASWLVLDLILEDPAAAKLPVIRLASHHFDPRALVPGSTNGLDAFRQWTALLLRESGAAPLPNAQAVQGQPFRNFASLEEYQREVLRAG